VPLVVDASIAIKWLLEEDDTDKAIAFADGNALIAPDFLLLECANVLTMKVRRGLLHSHAARELFATLLSGKTEFLSSRDFVDDAQVLALQLKQSSYDCLYLAIAIAGAHILHTADERFARAVLAHRNYRDFIRFF
jgi:predicted nucleic acid-binding protein